MNATKHPTGEQLQAFHDGELERALTSSVRDHCESCATCGAELAALDRLDEMLAGSRAPELPGSIWPRVRPETQGRSRLVPALAFAACAVGILLGVMLGPIRFGEEQVTGDVAWTETITIMSSETTSSLLNVYKTDQD